LEWDQDFRWKYKLSHYNAPLPIARTQFGGSGQWDLE
jgi:hypothetical protein